MECIKAKLKPSFNTCCECVDSQIRNEKFLDCYECCSLTDVYVYEFISPNKGKTFAVISYDNGRFDSVNIERLLVYKDK